MRTPHPDLRGLDFVRLNRTELIEVIKANREGHRQAFLEAQQGWHKIVVEELEKRMEQARRGQKVSGFFQYPEPVDHTNDYDRVLRMLEMSLDQQLELSQQDFAQYVMDDWAWKAQWTMSNAMYSDAARR